MSKWSMKAQPMIPDNELPRKDPDLIEQVKRGGHGQIVEDTGSHWILGNGWLEIVGDEIEPHTVIQVAHISYVMMSSDDKVLIAMQGRDPLTFDLVYPGTLIEALQHNGGVVISRLLVKR